MNSPTEFFKTHGRWLLLVVAAATFVIIFTGAVDYTQPPFSGWDLWRYRKMAQAVPGLAAGIDQPYGFRILGPYLAGLLPLPDPQAFYIVEIVSAYATVVLFYVFFVSVGLWPRNAAAAVLLLVFNKYFFGLNIWDYFQICDLASLAFLAGLFMAMHRCRWGIFGVLLVLGVLTKEVSVLMVPTAAAYLFEKRPLQSQWAKFLFAASAGLLAFVLLRMLIPSDGGRSLFAALREYSLKKLEPESIVRVFVNAFLPLSFVPLIFLSTSVDFFRTRKYALLFVILVGLSSLFGSNLERLLAPAAVVFYWLAGAIAQRENFNWKMLLAWLIPAFVSSFHHLYSRFLVPPREVTVYLAMAALGVATLASIVWRVRRLQGRVSPSSA